MPRRNKPGYRELIEAQLHAVDRAALDEWLFLLPLDGINWRVGPLGQVVEVVATLRFARRLRVAEDLGHQESIDLAARELGLHPATIRSRMSRMWEASRATDVKPDAA